MGDGGVSLLIPWVLVFVVFYVLIIAPQRKEQKEKDNLRKNLAKGDLVVTLGGLHGEVTKVEKDEITLKIADKSHAVFDRSAILRRLSST